jgi:hypothetical protein
VARAIDKESRQKYPVRLIRNSAKPIQFATDQDSVVSLSVVGAGVLIRVLLPN